MLLQLLLLIPLLSCFQVHNHIHDIDTTFETSERNLLMLHKHNFNQLTRQGNWAIFFGSRQCIHCKIYTPIWYKLQEGIKKEYGYALRLGKVDCLDDDSLCLEYNIDGYPTVLSFINGTKGQTFEPNVTYQENYKDYIEKTYQSNLIRLPRVFGLGINITDTPISKTVLKDASKENQINLKKAMMELAKIKNSKIEPNPSVNPEGGVIVLTKDSIKDKVKDGIWFVKFYAPWCGHCKQLAPIWEQLARILKGYVNVAHVDCTVEKDICKDYDIDRFPVLKILRPPHLEPVLYTGSRNLESLEKFALQWVTTPYFEAIEPSQISFYMKKQEVAFFLIYNPLDMKESILKTLFEPVARSFVGKTQFYISPFLDAKLPLPSNDASGLFVSREYGKVLESFHNPLLNYTQAKELSVWIQKNYSPLVPQLSDSNQNQVFDKQNVIVMAIVDPLETTKLDSITRTLGKVVKNKDKIQELTGRNIVIVWLDGIKYGSYVERVYKISIKDYPRLIIANPRDYEYFDVDEKNQILSLEKDDIILNSIQGALQGKLKATSQSGFWSFVLRLISKGFTNLTTFFGILVGIVLLYFITKTVYRLSTSSVSSTHKKD